MIVDNTVALTIVSLKYTVPVDYNQSACQVYLQYRACMLSIVELGLCHCSRLPGKIDNQTD